MPVNFVVPSKSSSEGLFIDLPVDGSRVVNYLKILKQGEVCALPSQEQTEVSSHCQK